MLTTWSNVNEKDFERTAQMMLRRRYTDLQSIDGSGGDGGKDAYLWTPSGMTVFEMKFFRDRVVSKRKRQVEKSLRTAVANHPKMSRWVLVIPLNPTPSEDEWFHGKLSELAPGVTLAWWGQDWFDAELTEHPAYRQAMEGPDRWVLGAAKEYKHEPEVLVHGAKDLLPRIDALRGRIDDISPNWALEFATQGTSTRLTLCAKSPQAPVIDPIKFVGNAVFAGTDRFQRRDTFNQHMDFGGTGTVELSDLCVEGSEESRRLLEGLLGPGQLEYISKVQTLEQQLRCQLQVRLAVGGPVVSTLDIALRRWMGGRRGVTFMGEDATGTVSIDLRMPRPSRMDEPAVLDGAGFTLTFKTLAGLDSDQAVQVLEFRDAAQPGRYLSPNLKMFKTDGVLLDEQPGGHVDDLLEVARVLDRLGALLGTGPMALPAEISDDDVILAKALVDSLEGRRGVTPFTSFKGNINAGREREFVENIERGPMQVYLEWPEGGCFEFGGLPVAVGILGFHSPSVVLANREEVLAAAPGTAVAELRSADGSPITILPREEMKQFAS
ncbi:hypothetical protein ACFVBP_10550 [Nocardioides sp. NPDC057764]|uniref:hypothetical protein n=1 Tax=Nocardioides sp. NPDC057764 TaxID=3346243 RepID=UPI003670B6A3